mmetsp:Transcript_23456/g.40160  ORF Transcript_23456/g.40160 Transcript_23456/m.40160 type:complete len:680 (-) Transcript_23456:197-2236(-)
MKVFVCVLVLATIPTFAARSEVTPVQKVIQLLEGMLQKGKDNKHGEEVQFAAYKQFCDDTVAEKAAAIAAGEEAAAGLKADIQKDTADAALLAKEIAAHEEDISVWKGDESAATKVREIEKADYDATHKDYSESVDAITRAIAVLKKQAYDRKQKTSLAQADVANLNNLKLIPDDAKKAINLFLAQGMEESEISAYAPEANAYEFQSQSIVDMLEKLQDKFVDQRTVLEKEEMNAKDAYSLLMQDLANEIAQATKEVSQKSSVKAQTLQHKADSEGALTDTTTTLQADVKYKTDLTGTCEQKATDFESRQTLRADEIEAIEKAIEILSSSAVSGNAEKYLPTGLIQKKGKKALAQLRASEAHITQERAAQFLKLRAEKLNSRVLSALAVRVSDDPFKKVKKMIKDLIQKLMAEGTTETEHKGWCDTQLATNKLTREDKAEEVEKLSAEVEGLNAEIVKLTQDIEETSAAIAEISDAMAKATAERTAAKEENEETMAEAKEAITALEQAIALIKDYYAKSAEATSLAQQTGSQTPAEDAPETWSKPFKGQLPEGGSVVDFLQVILSDFARLEADASSAESTQADVYKKYMFESEKDKALKVNAMEHMQNTVTDKKSMLHATEAELKASKGQLEKAIQYYEKLKPNCVDSGITYEERVRRREEEIQSLQEAIQILEGSDIA